MITLWGRENAYNVQKVLWLLDELKLEFRHHPVGSQPAELMSEGFLAINPHGRIPALRDQGLVVWESNTILRYLATRYGNSTLYPEDIISRTHVERWMDWELASWQPAFLDLFWHYYRTPESEHNSPLIDEAALRCGRLLQILDAQLAKQPYLAGEVFTLADISCGSALYRYFNMGYHGVIKPPHVVAWFHRLTKHPAYRKRIAISFDELHGRLAF